MSAKIIGLTSLGVQVFLLLPWHHTISEDIKNLQTEIKDLKCTIINDVVKKTDNYVCKI